MCRLGRFSRVAGLCVWSVCVAGAVRVEAVEALPIVEGVELQPLTAQVAVHLSNALALRGQMSEAIDVLANNVPVSVQYYPNELTLVAFALAVQYDRDEQRGAAFEVLDRMQNTLQGQLVAMVQNVLAGMRFAPAEDRQHRQKPGPHDRGGGGGVHVAHGTSVRERRGAERARAEGQPAGGQRMGDGESHPDGHHALGGPERTNVQGRCATIGGDDPAAQAPLRRRLPGPRARPHRPRGERRVPHRPRRAVGAGVGLVGGLGGFVLPIAFGALNDLAGVWQSCFWLLFLIVSVSLIWMHVAIREMEKTAAVAGVPIKKLPELPEMQRDAPGHIVRAR